jgi:hypothetical protein
MNMFAWPRHAERNEARFSRACSRETRHQPDVWMNLCGYLSDSPNRSTENSVRQQTHTVAKAANHGL